jgi:hypothetical protein
VRARILRLVERLREHEVAVSVAESMDAVAAVAAAGVDRPVLREALATTLVKDERDRATFDDLFDQTFPLPSPVRVRKTRRRAAAAGEGAESARGAASGGTPSPRPVRDEDGRAPTPEPGAETPEPSRDATRRLRAGERRTLLRRPFEQLGPREVEEARELLAELAARLRGRLARRERRRRHGRLDVRRVLRAATATGGVPLRMLWRGRRPDRPDLVALVDLSGSVATASELCLRLIAPAAAFFRRVHTFAYVDRPCPVAIEAGHLTPDGPLDLHARSDFGRVLEELLARHGTLLTGRTLLLVIGDARNNRRPPRADLLRLARDRVQRLVWLVPERRARWNTGDSVLAAYAPACDVVLECESLGALLTALARTL